MLKPQTERRLGAILAADVVGYTRLMGSDETGTYSRLKLLRRELIDPNIKAHGGRVVKSTGDGVLVEFASAVEAVMCAVEVQRAMADRNVKIVPEKRIVFRVGLNIGDLIIDQGDIYGDGVNIAARLEGLSAPGGICISSKVYEEVRDKLPYSFVDQGDQEVKNVARPVRAYALTAEQIAELSISEAQTAREPPRRRIHWMAAGAVATLGTIAVVVWFLPWTLQRQSSAGSPNIATVAGTKTPSQNPAPRLSIAVLPFSNLSSDPEQEYFADGITEDLTSDLSLIPGSFVIARNTAFTYKGKPVDVKQVGRDLGIRYVLEGSVRRIGDQVRLNAQLIEAETGAHVWAERFDFERAKLAEAQSELIATIARRLNVEVVRAEARRIEREQRDPIAIDHVMRGWATYNKPFTQANRAEAKSLFEKALATDPLSTEAMIGFVAAVAGNLTSGWPNTPEDIEKAEQLITQALHMQPDNALAHFAAGRLHRGRGRLVEAAQEQKVAFRLNPNDANVNNELAVVLNFLGRPLESLAYNEQAIRLNPLDPFRSTMLWAKGYSYLILGRFKEAIEALEQANSVNSKLWYVHLDWSSALAMDGRIEDARKEFAEHLRLRPDINTIERIGVVAPWILTVAQHWQMRDQTLNEGLRRIGVPER